MSGLRPGDTDAEVAAMAAYAVARADEIDRLRKLAKEWAERAYDRSFTPLGEVAFTALFMSITADAVALARKHAPKVSEGGTSMRAAGEKPRSGIGPDVRPDDQQYEGGAGDEDPARGGGSSDASAVKVAPPPGRTELRPSDTDEDGDPVDWLERARLRDLRPSDADADALRSWRDRVIEAVRDFGREADELWSRVGGKLSGADLQYVAKREALRALVRGASAPRAPVGVRAPNPEAAVPPREEPFYVDGRPIEVDDDDDDARGWTVNGRPVSARDVDHGDAQAEAENPWTVNGAPIPEPKDEHAKCRARLEAEKARVRRAIGLLTDIAKPARVAIGFLDAEEPRG